jgi:ATP-dependent RNA helicase RhlE
MTDNAFTALGLAPAIVQALSEQGYQVPTPVQQQAVPAILAGRDVLVAAQTGTGKTAGFVCPLLDRLVAGPAVGINQVRALILVPTRELAVQVHMSVRTYGQHLDLRSMAVFGGVKINPQMMQLRRGVDVLVATPGRLLDLAAQHALTFEQLEVLVLDEADRMLDLGFSRELDAIMRQLPSQRQTLMFSATFPTGVRQLASLLVNNPLEIIVSPEQTTAENVKQWVCPVDKKRKPALLVHLILEYYATQLMVFTNTKQGADKLTRFLQDAGITAAAIHGDRSQGQRMEALRLFKQQGFQVLVATDVAARGLDIEQLPQVVNFDLPKVAENYIHRIGRTGRAGAAGEAISLVSADEIDALKAIEHLVQQVLPREYVEDFFPDHQLPASPPISGPVRPKKPKKPKKPYEAAAGAPSPSGARAAPAKNRPAAAGKYKGKVEGKAALKGAAKGVAKDPATKGKGKGGPKAKRPGKNARNAARPTP